MATIDVFDRAAGTWVPAQDTDVTGMVASGKYGLQSGIDIPVTFADGTAGTVPSDEFEKHAQTGAVRFQTADDLRAYEDQQKASILQEHSPGILQSAVLGGMRGASFGLSDAGMVGVAAIAGHGQDVQQQLQEGQTNHPIASGLGELGGTIAAAPFTGVLGAAEGLGERAAGSALAKLGESRAAQIVQTIGEHAGSGLVGGAVLGLGSGISEAALGDPHEIAQNLASGTAMGALFGGAFGSAFGAAKASSPFFKAVVNRVTDTASDLVQAGLRKTGSAIASVTLSAQGEQELAKLVPSLVNDPIMRQAYATGGAALVKDIESQATQWEKTLQGNLEKGQEALDTALAGVPKKIRNQIQDDLKTATGDMGGALDIGLARLETNKQHLYGAMKADLTEGGQFEDIYNKTIATVKELESTKDLGAKAVASRLEARLNAEMANRGIYMRDGKLAVGDLAKGMPTEGQEGILTRELRETTRLGMETRKSLPGAARDALEDHYKQMTSLMGDNPTWGKELLRLNDMGEAFDAARRFATGADRGGTDVKNSVIKSILGDPRKAREFDQVLGNLSNYMPEFQAYRSAGNDAVQKMNALRSASAKFDAIREQAFDRGLTLTDFQNMFDSFKGAPKNIGEKIGEMQSIQAQLSQTDAGAVSKYMRLAKFMGNEVPADISRLQPFQQGFEGMKKIMAKAGPEEDNFKSFAMKLGAQRVARKLGYVVGGPILGEAAGMAAGALLKSGTAAANTLKTLTALESASQKSFRIMSGAIRGTAAALTGQTVERGIVKYNVDDKRRTLGEARKDFKERQKYLGRLVSDPMFMADEAQKRIVGLEAAPNVSMALSGQFANTANFLHSKMPADPLAGGSLSLHHSPWQPSDMDLAKFERYVDAAENPVRVVADIGKGKFSPEAVETLQALQPAAFGKLRQEVTNGIINQEEPTLTYNQRMSIGQVLGVKGDVTLDPNFIMAMQANWQPSPGRPATQGQGPQGNQPVHPARLNINTGAALTETQQATFPT